MTEAAGSSPGPSAPGAERWAGCSRPGADLQHTCAHLPAPGGLARPAPPGGLVLRDGNVESALYCPTSALQQLQVKTDRFLSTSRKGNRQRQRAPGNECGTPVGTRLRALRYLI